MMEPLPNCFSIWDSAAASALLLFSSMNIPLKSGRIIAYVVPGWKAKAYPSHLDDYCSNPLPFRNPRRTPERWLVTESRQNVGVEILFRLCLVQRQQRAVNPAHFRTLARDGVIHPQAVQRIHILRLNAHCLPVSVYRVTI